jgi:ATP-dependent Clp protease ATP-binding subunit ClpC
MRQAQWLSERFRAIHVRPFNDNETLEVLKARRQTYEKFHEVTYSDEALTTVVNESGRYLADRVLPGKALQLIDAAGARVKLRQPVVSPEAAEIRKKINFIVRRRDSAIQNHEFEKARFYSEEERKEREILMTLQREAKVPAASSSVVRAQDVEEVIARWDEYPFQP